MFLILSFSRVPKKSETKHDKKNSNWNENCEQKIICEKCKQCEEERMCVRYCTKFNRQLNADQERKIFLCFSRRIVATLSAIMVLHHYKQMHTHFFSSATIAVDRSRSFRSFRFSFAPTHYFIYHTIQSNWINTPSSCIVSVYLLLFITL